jgi:hypothetical protein
MEQITFFNLRNLPLKPLVANVAGEIELLGYSTESGTRLRNLSGDIRACQI